jgi:hypothetical protein
MVEYYFDIETYSLGGKPNVAEDKIIAIQYQELSPFEGNPRGDLQILTEWGYGSEKALLEGFAKVFLTENVWDFVPIGFNLYGFDLPSLLSRYDHHFGTSHGLAWLYDKPVLDIKPTLVMLEKGSFKGCGDIFGKRELNPIRAWYESGDTGHAQIVAYIEHEAYQFIRLYQSLKWEIPQLKPQFQKVIA